MWTVIYILNVRKTNIGFYSPQSPLTVFGAIPFPFLTVNKQDTVKVNFFV